MVFDSALEEGRFVRRYQRFFAEIRLASGELITSHCPNTGSMLNCFSNGGAVWVSRSKNPRRKLGYTWELSTSPEGEVVGVNTGRANHLVREAIADGLIAEIGKFESLQAEVPYGRENSRIDFVATAEKGKIYIEVKSVTLCQGGGKGYFPDCISTRATRHLRELQAICESGARALLVFCVQHSGIRTVAPAGHLDVAYSVAFEEARRAGLEVVALGATMSRLGISLDRRLEVCINPL